MVGLAATAVLGLMLSGCGSASSTSLTGSAADELTAVVAQAEADGAQLAVAETSAIGSDQAQQQLGLSAADFDSYVDNAAVSQAMISTSAHEVALVKLKDAAQAAKVKDLIAAGFDSGKWICVRPEKSLVIDSGPYVLLVASTSDTAAAVVAAFKAKAGSTGAENVFFTG